MVVLVVLFKRADSHYVCPERRSSEEVKVFGGFPQFVKTGKMVRWNRISHPDMVKICVDPNGQIKLRVKQKYEVLSATDAPKIGNADGLKYFVTTVHESQSCIGPHKLTLCHIRSKGKVGYISNAQLASVFFWGGRSVTSLLF